MRSIAPLYVLLLTLLPVVRVFAQSPNIGMRLEEVAVQYGAPKSCIEYETLRRQRCQFEDFSVTFVEGRAQSVDSMNQQSEPMPTKRPHSQKHLKRPVTTPFSNVDFDSEAFFSELSLQEGSATPQPQIGRRPPFVKK